MLFYSAKPNSYNFRTPKNILNFLPKNFQFSKFEASDVLYRIFSVFTENIFETRNWETYNLGSRKHWNSGKLPFACRGGGSDSTPYMTWSQTKFWFISKGKVVQDSAVGVEPRFYSTLLKVEQIFIWKEIRVLFNMSFCGGDPSPHTSIWQLIILLIWLSRKQKQWCPRTKIIFICKKERCGEISNKFQCWWKVFVYHWKPELFHKLFGYRITTISS